MEPKPFFKKEYNWESLYDLDRDMAELFDEPGAPEGGEFKGTIKVVVTYYPEEPS